MTSGRTSRDPNATSSAVPTDSSAENAKTGESAQPKPSIRMPASAGPIANPTAPDAPKSAIAVPSRRRGVTSRMPASMIPVLPELEPDQQHRNGELPRLAREGDGHEDDRLDQRAPDDHDLAAVLVGPGAPERDERHADDEDQRAEDADEGETILLGHAHLAQVGREQREDLADAETLDHRRDPEDREQDPPILDGAGRDGGWRSGGIGRVGHGHSRSLWEAEFERGGLVPGR